MARSWLQQLLSRLFQPISRDDALRTVSEAVDHKVRDIPLICHETQPPNCRIYADPPEPCWYIYAPWDDQKDAPALRADRVILVGKHTGTIHYDGSAGNEG
jgi:hypothetical protein